MDMLQFKSPVLVQADDGPYCVLIDGIHTRFQKMDMDPWTKRYIYLLRFKESVTCRPMLKAFASDFVELKTSSSLSASLSRLQLQIRYEGLGREYLKTRTFQEYARPYNALAHTPDLQADYAQLNDPYLLDCLIDDILITNKTYTEALRRLSHQGRLTLFLGFPEARIKRAVGMFFLTLFSNQYSTTLTGFAETRNRLYAPYERYHTLRISHSDAPFSAQLGSGLKNKSLISLLNLETTEQTTGRDIVNAALELIDDDEKSKELTAEITAQLNVFMDNLVQIYINSQKSEIPVAAATVTSSLDPSETCLQRSPPRKKMAFRYTPSRRNRRPFSNLASPSSTVHESASPDLMLSAPLRQLPSRYLPPSVEMTHGTSSLSSSAPSSPLYSSLLHLAVMACLGVTSISQRAFRPSLFAQATKPAMLLCGNCQKFRFYRR